jgi:hypothetical protein
MATSEEQPKVIVRNIEEIPVELVTPDPNNPNRMSDEQMAGLRESFKEFGFLHPIVVDKNYMLCDGYHRLQIYKEFGKATIPAYVFDFRDEQSRMMLRQVMNKLKGKHDLELDAIELQKLIEYDKDKLSTFIQFREQNLQELRELIESNKTYSGEELQKQDLSQVVSKDGNPTSHYADSYLHGNIKQITAYFDNDTYTKVMEIIQPMLVELNLTNHTDLIYNLIYYYHRMKKQFPIKPEEIIQADAPDRSKVVYTA